MNFVRPASLLTKNVRLPMRLMPRGGTVPNFGSKARTLQVCGCRLRSGVVTDGIEELKARLAGCTICTERFAATSTAHEPNPIIWFNGSARVLIASQAPGIRVHQANKPFWDASGRRLRDWLGLDEATFYDRDQVAIVPMAFCFPGYDAGGSDLPPPSVCAKTWRSSVLSRLGGLRLTLLIGGYAQKWHLGTAAARGVTSTVASWRDHPPDIIPLPHPSWRNVGWLKRNPWFEDELLPVIRARVAAALE
jgi:uracil-DNA glycosylase